MLKMGFGDPIKDTVVDRGPWVCIARRGFTPEDHVAAEHIEDCWQDMFDATQGVWDDRRIPMYKVAREGKEVQLVLNDGPVNQEDLEDTKMRCEQEDDCEAVCVHEKK